MAKPRISPDGTKLTYLKPDRNNVLNVWVKDIDKNNDKMITDDTKRCIRSYM